MLAENNIEKPKSLLDKLLDFIKENSDEFDTQITGTGTMFSKDYLIVFNEGKGYYIDTETLNSLENTELEKELCSEFFKALREITSIQVKVQAYLASFGYRQVILSPEEREKLDAKISTLSGKKEIISIQSSTQEQIHNATT